MPLQTIEDGEAGLQKQKITHLCISQFQLRPCPPRANPRALALFFSWMANSPGVGTLKLPNAPRWGRRKKANAPPPGSYVPNQHCSSSHSLHNNARPPGRAKFANAPPPELTGCANAPQLPGGGDGRSWN